MVKKKDFNESKTPNIIQIGANTQIVFTLKGFIGTILSILLIFYAFYQLVIVPKINATEAHYQTMYLEQKKENKDVGKRLEDIEISINTLSTTIALLNPQQIKIKSQKNDDTTKNNSINISGLLNYNINKEFANNTHYNNN